jgi:Ca-activated chloride channel family protein
VLTNIQVRGDGFELYDLEPAKVPDLFADRPLEIVGKWKGQPRGQIIITGTTANGPYETAFDVATASTNHPALRPLWARERARVLGDYAALNDSRAKTSLKDLGLKYGLLTEQTSFVAVDEQPQQLASNAVPVQQPLPLPQGVSQSAVGSAGSVPEPGAMSLLMFALTVLALHRRR